MATQRTLPLCCILIAGLLVAASAWAERQETEPKGKSAASDLVEEAAADSSVEGGEQGGVQSVEPTPPSDAGERPADAGERPADSPAAGEASGSATSLALKMSAVTIFMLAIFVGFEIITKVPPTLHTPLMSGSNAISGIAMVGALLVVLGANVATSLVGFIAVLLATINVVGGFLVTHRMLAMFQKR